MIDLSVLPPFKVGEVFDIECEYLPDNVKVGDHHAINVKGPDGLIQYCVGEVAGVFDDVVGMEIVRAYGGE